ncbi:hypothetical protein [Streptomyces roseoviridis]|uniref:Uncharacterized protein n=1 Tax=Streptomyces roseoviridis TaxID=67361 RepID=A0ABV5QXJ1_9ACTN
MAALWWPRTEVTYRSTQPSSVVYEDGFPHVLSLVHEHTLSGRHRYRLVIGRDASASYGHWVEVEPYVAAQGVDSTTWTGQAVRIRFRTGHELAVPARFFLYGR